MKNAALTIFLLLCMGSLPVISHAVDQQPAAEAGASAQQVSSSPNGAFLANSSEKADTPPAASLVRDAATRRTPPWTNDSANIHNKQPRTPSQPSEVTPYSASELTVKPEWKKLFSDDDHFSATSGKELYKSMCQACHMPDGQGAEGAGIYPSFVGNERLRSSSYPIDVVIHGLRGMPSFGEKLSNQQIADVVNYLRTNFGNQLAGDTTVNDVARVRH